MLSGLTSNLPKTVRVDPLDRIVAGSSNRVERRFADGTFDDSFTLSDQTIFDIEVLPDSKVLTLARKFINETVYAELNQRHP